MDRRLVAWGYYEIMCYDHDIVVMRFCFMHSLKRQITTQQRRLYTDIKGRCHNGDSAVVDADDWNASVSRREVTYIDICFKLFTYCFNHNIDPNLWRQTIITPNYKNSDTDLRYT